MSTTRFQSHQVLGRLLQLSLTPVAITVNIEVDLLGKSPKADALLLRRQGRAWNAAQRARLPDGVRNSTASHVLIVKRAVCGHRVQVYRICQRTRPHPSGGVRPLLPSSAEVA